MIPALFKFFGIFLLCGLALPGAAIAEIVVRDAYLRLAHPNAPTAAAFMVLDNTGDAPDRLVSAASDIAQRVELHSHMEAGDGVMNMREVEGGLEIPPGGSRALQRGGDHVMFMGLNAALQQGDTVTVILSFEQAGEVTVTIPVDNTKQP